jgi:guanylate cyclase
MIYLHDSAIISHGNLKSSNCLVDSRWVLQISDFGLHEFRANQDPLTKAEEAKRERGLLWKAPEFLRSDNPIGRGTQKGDVYSFAIVLYEIIGRKGPWGHNPPAIKAIVEAVANPDEGKGYYRPPLHQILKQPTCQDYIVKCMEDCWEEEPEARPDFRFINIRLKEMQAGL